jgi:hypothetical protein
MTIDVNVLIAIATGLLGLVGWLISKIVGHYEKKLADAKASVTKLHTRLDEVAKQLGDRLDKETEQRVQQHDASVERIFISIDSVKRDVNDLNVTVAGIGGIYATRDEVNRLRDGSRGSQR